MHKIWLILRREYVTRVRKTSFILLTLLAPLGLSLLVILPLLLTSGMEPEKQLILVADESGEFQNLKDTNNIYFKIEKDISSIDSLKASYAKMGYTALLHIPNVDLNKGHSLEIHCRRNLSLPTKIYIEKILADRVETDNLSALNLPAGWDILRPDISLITVTGDGKIRRRSNAIIASAIGYSLGFTMYMVLLIYGTMVMRGVMEEKTNRIVEVMVSSVKPFQLMAGKVLGIGAVGLTQFAIWVVLGLSVQMLLGVVFFEDFQRFQEINNGMNPDAGRQARLIAEAYADLQNLPLLKIFAVFTFYFLGGYLLYSSLFAAIGSLANDDGGDIQLYTFPVTLPIMASIMIMIAVIQKPHSTLAVIASIFPLSAPIVMPARIPFIGFGWEVALSMLGLCVGIVFSTWLAGRIYRTGILMYGKQIKPGEVMRWLRYKH